MQKFSRVLNIGLSKGVIIHIPCIEASMIAQGWIIFADFENNFCSGEQSPNAIDFSFPIFILGSFLHPYFSSFISRA